MILATLESIDHIIEAEAWGTKVVISRQTVENEKIHVKILEIKSEDKFRLKTETIDLVGEL